MGFPKLNKFKFSFTLQVETNDLSSLFLLYQLYWRWKYQEKKLQTFSRQHFHRMQSFARNPNYWWLILNLECNTTHHLNEKTVAESDAIFITCRVFQKEQKERLQDKNEELASDLEKCTRYSHWKLMKSPRFSKNHRPISLLSITEVVKTIIRTCWSSW